MHSFIQKFTTKVTATIECFDRVIFKGHVRPLSFPQGMERLLARHGLLIKDFARFVETHSNRLVQHAKNMAAKQNRPYQYLRRKSRKDDLTRRIAERDGIRQGLVCIVSVLESCPSFKVAYAKGRPRIEPAYRKCLCLYYYFLHPQLGPIHVRLQTWFPFVIQIAVNGHEWLARQMKEHRLGFLQLDNAFLRIANPVEAQRLAKQFCRLNWPALLEKLARSANHHYLTALSVASDPAPAQKLLRLCTARVHYNQRSYRGFNPAAEHDISLFKALLQGQHHLHGFRNAAVRALLYPSAPSDVLTQRRLAARVHRLLKRLHVRGLIARIPRSRRWRVSANGHAFMAMAIKHHDHIYLDTLAQAA